MASVVSDSFRIKNAADLIESINEDSLYLFIGNTLPWTLRGSTDTTPPIPLDTISESQRSHWSDMIGAKRVTSSDAVHMVRRIDWRTGTAYDAYDSNNANLFRTNFYVLTLPEYNVYKCLQKGSGNSTEKPTATVSSGTQTFSDGYIWKYMYTIGTGDAIKFLTPQHMPVRNLANGTALTNKVIFGTESANPVSRDGQVGHGYDAVRELGAYFVGCNVRLEYSESGAFTVDNEYRKIGLVYNPILNDGSNNIATQSVIRQTTLLTLTTAPTNNFQTDEIITQTGGASARVVEHSSGDRTKVYVVMTAGSFIAGGANIVGQTSGTTAQISSAANSILAPQLKTNSGDVIFVEYRRPIPRSGDQVESLSVILEF